MALLDVVGLGALPALPAGAPARAVRETDGEDRGPGGNREDDRVALADHERVVEGEGDGGAEERCQHEGRGLAQQLVARRRLATVCLLADTHPGLVRRVVERL